MQVMNDWWNAPCEPMGGCITAFMSSAEDLVVWPVWRNPQDGEEWSLKVHDLSTDRWTKHSGHMCKRHTALAVQSWEVDTKEDVDVMERTDEWAVKNGGRI